MKNSHENENQKNNQKVMLIGHAPLLVLRKKERANKQYCLRKRTCITPEGFNVKLAKTKKKLNRLLFP